MRISRLKWLKLVWGFKLRCWLGAVGAYATPRLVGGWLGLGAYGWCIYNYPEAALIVTGLILGALLVTYLLLALGTNSWDLKGMNDDNID